MAYSATYTDEDISPAVMDGIVAFLVQLVPFASLIALGVIILFLMKIWKRISGKR